ncbi:hypothetical protein Pla108_12500 [Botrimarina colliarenosi]|uniref:Uncharacterized protein n=2 Tax=Botrimarina colliarenosi TaxID=2528001 RepID=A0A5C6ALL7_9BACT|nr:hypothetical protein Pla108_12500 [Botrimarina colliarenosi]
MLAGLVLVIGLMSRLEQPETHRAIGRALGEPAATALPAAASEAPPLVTAETFSEVRDNAPFRSDEQPAWFASLAAVAEHEAAELASQSAGLVGYAALTSQPDAYRGRVVTVAGRALRVEAVEPAANDLGVTELWRVTLEPVGGEVWPITVYTLEEPADATEPYDASAVGVFYKKLSYRWAEGVGSTPVIVARRLETTLTMPAVEPDAVKPNAATPPTDEVAFGAPAAGSMGAALLAELGFDVELFAKVVDQQRLRSEESEAFYALLGAVEATPASQLARLARTGLDDYVARHRRAAGDTVRDRWVIRSLETEQAQRRYSVTPLFGEGAAERGELVVFDAIVRRAVRVDASASDAAARRGIDHYFELEAFTEDSQNLPIVFVVRELPAGFPVGDAIRQPARLAGFFFKQWAYRSRTRTERGNDRRQFAPLLVGRAPIPLALPDAATIRPGTAIGLAATVALVAVAAALWRLSRRDKAYESATLARYRSAGDAAAHDFDRLNDLADPPGAGA